MYHIETDDKKCSSKACFSSGCYDVSSQKGHQVQKWFSALDMTNSFHSIKVNDGLNKSVHVSKRWQECSCGKSVDSCPATINGICCI